MTGQSDVVAVDAQASAQQLALAAGVLARRSGVIVLAGVVVVRPTRTELLCEVVDPMPSSHRCAYEYEVLVENARRALEASDLQDLLPDLPCRWSVVEDCGSGTRELWHAPRPLAR
jgi:hypothetical protein